MFTFKYSMQKRTNRPSYNSNMCTQYTLYPPEMEVKPKTKHTISLTIHLIWYEYMCVFFTMLWTSSIAMNDDATIVVEWHSTKPKHRSIHLNLNATNILIELAKDNRIAAKLPNDYRAKDWEFHCTIWNIYFCF